MSLFSKPTPTKKLREISCIGASKAYSDEPDMSNLDKIRYGRPNALYFNQMGGYTVSINSSMTTRTFIKLQDALDMYESALNITLVYPKSFLPILEKESHFYIPTILEILDKAKRVYAEMKEKYYDVHIGGLKRVFPNGEVVMIIDGNAKFDINDDEINVFIERNKGYFHNSLTEIAQYMIHEGKTFREAAKVALLSPYRKYEKEANERRGVSHG